MKKIDFQFLKNRPARSLRVKLLGFFIIYGLALLALLWIMELTLLGSYYQRSMEKKCREGIYRVSVIYSMDEDLGYNEFCSEIGTLSMENDIYFLVESQDGMFSISSADVSSPGRFFPETNKIMSDAKKMLESSGKDEISFSSHSAGMKSATIVFAKKVESRFRGPVYIYAVASLAPLGPALEILRSQLLFTSVIVLVLGVIVAVISSKHLAKPMAAINKEAKKLGLGDFDVNFAQGDYLEINELADTLNEAATELKTSDDLRKDLLANVSHDLRTPLTMIKSYAEMIRDLSGDNREKREEHLGVIIDETDRLAGLVGDILLLSRVQSGAESFTLERFDLARAANEIFQTYKIVEEDGFTLIFEQPTFPCTVYADKAKIKQVISNFLSNAVKYSEDNKYVRVFFEREDGCIKLCVEDKGIGINKDLQENIWSRYQRSSQKAARSKEGSGLGLSICSEILKRHDAEYGFESSLGEGSCFWFKLKQAK